MQRWVEKKRISLLATSIHRCRAIWIWKLKGFYRASRNFQYVVGFNVFGQGGWQTLENFYSILTWHQAEPRKMCEDPFSEATLVTLWGHRWKRWKAGFCFGVIQPVHHPALNQSVAHINLWIKNIAFFQNSWLTVVCLWPWPSIKAEEIAVEKQSAIWNRVFATWREQETLFYK